MAIECYDTTCIYHEKEEPFCHEPHCHQFTAWRCSCCGKVSSEKFECRGVKEYVCVAIRQK